MQIDQLANLLRRSYETAPNRDESLADRLFGIKYADEIGASTNSILEIAKIGNYGPEIRKGIKLSRYVDLKT